DVASAERNHIDEPFPLGDDADAGGVDPSPLVERPRTRLQSVSVQEVARDYNLSTRGRSPVHGVLISRMRACERGRGLKPLPRPGLGPAMHSGGIWHPRTDERPPHCGERVKSTASCSKFMGRERPGRLWTDS